MFEEEIWLNLTAPLKHQLDSGAVVAVDDSMANKCVNALRWDGRGWWCAGLDGTGVVDVLHHHGLMPGEHVLGLVGGGGAARSTAAAWASLGGGVHQLKSRRMFEDGPWMEAITDQSPDMVVDFDNDEPVSEGFVCCVHRTVPWKEPLKNAQGNFRNALDGRWLLVAQHLACWRVLWAPERATNSLAWLVADACLRPNVCWLPMHETEDSLIHEPDWVARGPHATLHSRWSA